MLFDIDLDTDDQQGRPNVVRATWTRESPSPLRIHLFEGDVTRTGAEAVCTSTNGRLSLMAGSGGDVRDRGGWSIKRQCEAILEQHQRETGESELPPGSVRATKAGMLPARLVIHCVASDSAHNSSREIVRECARGVLAAASESSCRSIAMPVFATGHAAFRFDDALDEIARVLGETEESLDEVFIVALTPDRIEQARKILDDRFSR